jgi:exopolysaccharide production protein ExoZ
VPLNVQPIIAVYWTLCYEITFYALVALCLWLLGRKSNFSFYSGLNVLTVVSLIWLIVSPSTCPFPLNMWYQFGLGALVYMLITCPQSRPIQIHFGVVIILAILFAFLHQGTHSLGHPSSRIQTVSCTAFALVLLGLYRFDATITRNRAVKVLEWLGAFSYSLYLSHFFIIPIPQQIAKKLGFAGGTYWVSFLAQIIVAIAFAYVFHIVFERPFLSSRAKVREAQIRFQEIPGKETVSDVP